SGNAHIKAATEEEALDIVRDLLDYIPANNTEKSHARPIPPPDAPDEEYRPDLTEIVPFQTTRPDDVKQVIEQVVDNNSFYEIHKYFANNIVIGFARINEQPVVLVCNQPKYLAGGLDIDASDKASRFIR